MEKYKLSITFNSYSEITEIDTDQVDEIKTNYHKFIYNDRTRNFDYELSRKLISYFMRLFTLNFKYNPIHLNLIELKINWIDKRVELIMSDQI